MVTVLGAVSASSTWASEPYGEVTRFGGAVNEFASGSISAADEGKFVMPVGFAVEPKNPKTGEENDVYVLDRTISSPVSGKGELDYRLQKLTSTGTLLASTTITEHYSNTKEFSDAHPLISLAIDPGEERVYTIVENMVEEPEEPAGDEVFWPVTGAVVAWSTKPVNKELVRASSNELSEDPVTKASVVAGSTKPGSSDLEGNETGKDLYAPEGLAVDAQTHDLVVEAQEGVLLEKDGPTVLQRIATKGTEAGKKVGTPWKANSTLAPNAEPAAGLLVSTDGSGSFGVDLQQDGGTAGSPARLVTVSNDFTTASLVAESSLSNVNAEDVDQAAGISLSYTPNFDKLNTHHEDGLNKEGKALQVLTAGSPMVQLTDSNHLYAALYGKEDGGPQPDLQAGVEPWMGETGGKEPNMFWLLGGASDGGWANVGVRLFEADGKIVDTIGGGEPTAAPNAGPSALLGSCDIDYQNASVVAGANGSIFVLTQADKEYSPAAGDEVIEFAPNGGHQCPSVSGNIEVNGKEVHAENGEPTPKVTVAAGVKTKFDAISLDGQLGWNPTGVNITSPPGPFEWHPVKWTPFTFEWNFGDEPTGGPNKDGYTDIHKIESGAGRYFWPTPEAEHEYTVPGTYEADVRVSGDFGTNIFPVKVKVLASEPPKALFTPPTSITAGEPVVFDASASVPTPGAEIEDYQWEFGDGSPVVHKGTQAKAEHTFTTPGKYTVKLTVHDHEGSETEASVTHEVTVTESSAKIKEEEAKKKAEEEEAAAKKKSEEEAAAKAAATKKAEEEAAAKKKAEEEAAAKRGTPPAPPVSKSTTIKPLTTAQKLAKALKVCKKIKAKKKRISCEKLAKKKYGKKSKKGATK